MRKKGSCRGTERSVPDTEHGAAQVPTASCAENAVEGGPYGLFAFVIFVEVYQKVRFYKDLIVCSVHIRVGMVMSYKVANAFHDVRLDAETFKQATALTLTQSTLQLQNML